RNGTKAVGHLLSEIHSEECGLAKNAYDKLVRTVLACAADICYTDKKSKKLRLKENKQVFKDGSERKRDYLTMSVYGKMKPGEDRKKAMGREIEEELGIEEKDYSLSYRGINEQTVEARSYPGLLTHYTWYEFVVELAEDGFKPEGYKEVQSDKTTYFVWEKATGKNPS
ncbi:MAG: NUDIX domain-containing protein, partial [bacterium]|nr:NUDIX domain-containing protein [bacterium]